MTGHLGFSYIGFIYLFMLFVPNIMWLKNLPTDYDKIVGNENKILLLFERIGQVLVTICALIFLDFNISPFSYWTVWLIASFALMLMYECWWFKYFTHEKTLENFYGSFFGIPVPGATLPILAFLLLGIYGKVIWMLISTLILGIGHIGIHLQHSKAIK